MSKEIMNINEKLMKIQSELVAPKDLENKFGKYMYRSAESILEALKPLLLKYKCTLVVNDEIVGVGERIYIKATATLLDTESISVVGTSAFAREDERQSGMASAQLTGSTSSYARKYALNGLFAIDDNKDPDSTNKHGKENANKQRPAEPTLDDMNATIKSVLEAKTEEELTAIWTSNKSLQGNQRFYDAVQDRNRKLKGVK